MNVLAQPYDILKEFYEKPYYITIYNKWLDMVINLNLITIVTECNDNNDWDIQNFRLCGNA